MRTPRLALAAALSLLVTPLAVVLSAPAAHASGPDIEITEVAYGGLNTVETTSSGKGGDGEYVELTNVGDASQSFSGWKYFTDTNASDTTPSSEPSTGGIDLSSFGTVAPGESVIITDLTPADFRTEWGLKSTVKVVQDTNWDPNNRTTAPTVKVTLDGGPDDINVFDSSGAVADHAWYAANTIGYGSPKAKQKGVAVYAASAGDLSATDLSSWAGPSNATTTGDADAWTSSSGALGSPGASTLGTSTPTSVRLTGVSVTGGSNQSATVGTAFSYSGLSASGGTGSYTWSATGLPADGLSIDSSTGAITGTPTSGSTINVTVTATDTASASANASFTITVAGAVDPNWRNIVINEVTSDNYDNTELTSHLPSALLTALGAGTSGASDLIELYNDGGTAVDVTGWKQMDSGSPSSARAFSSVLYDVSGQAITSIPAHGYGVFSSDSASTKGLSSGGDGVQIYLPDGTTLVDAISWGAAQAGVDSSVGDEVYHALARCGGNDAGTVSAGVITTSANDTSGAGAEWYSVKAASFGTSNASACDTSTDTSAAVRHYNEQPPTGLASGCLPSAPSGSDAIAVGDAKAWPTADGVTTVDSPCEFITAQDPIGNDMSSLVFSSDGSVLWGAQNKNHLWKLVKSGSTYVPATDNSWGAGKGITFSGTDPAASQPDDEGMTVGGNGDLFVTSERDNTNSNTSKDEVLEYDATASGTTLAPVRQWNLTSEFAPSIIAATGDDANLGFEGVTYVPDSFLTAHGFYDQHAQHAYDPADYPNHIGSGLFFLGLEKNGHVYAYELNSDGTTFQRIADIDTGIDGSSAIADLQFNADDQGIWTQCDNDCGVVASLLRIDASGSFARVASYSRPAGLPDDNFEGFAIAPASTATDGKRQVVWSDDGIYGEGNGWNADQTTNAPSAGWGHALYASTIPVESDYTTITGTVMSTARVGTAYSSAALTAAGAFPDVPTWSVSSGSLPAGLTLNTATGAITGTPTALGTSTFTLAVTNGDGAPATQQASIAVTSAIIGTFPPPATQTCPDGSVIAATSTCPPVTVGSGGSSGTVTVNVPTTNGPDGVSGTVSDGWITSAINAASASGSSAPTLSIDVTGDGAQASTPTSVTIPSTAFTAVSGSTVHDVEITADAGMLVLDKAAINAIGAAGTIGSSVVISVTPVTTGTYTISIAVGGSQLHSLSGGQVTASFPYTLPSARAVSPASASDVVVVYHGADGSIELMPTSYSSGMVTFTTPHLSTFEVASRSSVIAAATPGKVRFGSATATTSSVTLKLKRLAGAASIQVRYGKAGTPQSGWKTKVIAGTSASFTVRGLKKGTTYAFVVRAYNDLTTYQGVTPVAMPVYGVTSTMKVATKTPAQRPAKGPGKKRHTARH